MTDQDRVTAHLQAAEGELPPGFRPPWNPKHSPDLLERFAEMLERAAYEIRQAAKFRRAVVSVEQAEAAACTRCTPERFCRDHWDL